MNQKQNDHVDMFKLTDQTLNNFKSVWDGNTLFISLVGMLKNSITEILETDQLQSNGTNVVPQNKNIAKYQLVSQVVTQACAGKGYAASINNHALKAACHLVKSKLLSLSPEDLIVVSQNLHNRLNPVIANLTNWGANPASLTSLQKAIAAFTHITDTSQTTKTSTKAATETISQLIKKVVDFLDELMDPAMLQFKATNANFYIQYRNARKVTLRGHRTRVLINGLVSVGINPVANAEIELTVNGKMRKKITGTNGKFSFLLNLPVNTNVSASLNGFPKQTKTITSGMPQTLSVNFVFIR
jgi:hypothetical protein